MSLYLPTVWCPMRRKTEVVSFKTTPAIKRALGAIGDREHRSKANVIEHLVLEYCTKHGIATDDAGSESLVAANAGKPGGGKK